MPIGDDEKALADEMARRRAQKVKLGDSGEFGSDPDAPVSKETALAFWKAKQAERKGPKIERYVCAMPRVVHVGDVALSMTGTNVAFFPQMLGVPLGATDVELSVRRYNQDAFAVLPIEAAFMDAGGRWFRTVGESEILNDPTRRIAPGDTALVRMKLTGDDRFAPMLIGPAPMPEPVPEDAP
jgi:hypothetical protein